MNVPRKLFTSLLCPSMKVTEDQLETDVNLLNMERAVMRMNRRNFLNALTAAGAGAAALGASAFLPKAEAQTTAPTIVDVLNFALNLEFLEANLYIAVSGSAALTSAETGGGPAPENAPTMLAGTLDASTQAVAAALAADETHHIQDLISAITSLSGTPITQPQIDYSAGGTVSITTQAQFLAAARQFTAVGNSAYAGAAQFLVSNVNVLTTAAQILGAEGQHLGAVNYLCNMQGVISPAVDAQDYPPVPTNTSYFTITPTNYSPTPNDPVGPASGVARTTSQVLGIVYGVSNASTATPPTGTTSGGFFPKGVNGAIVST